MSIKALSWAFDLELNAREKIVLLSLANCLNELTGRCDPSLEYIGRKAGISKRGVIRALEILADDEHKMITIERSHGASNKYIVHVPGGDTLAPPRDSTSANLSKSGANLSKSGANLAPKTSKQLETTRARARDGKPSTLALQNSDTGTPWRQRVEAWQRKRFWASSFGPPPNDPETRVPADVLLAFDIPNPVTA